MKILLTAFEPFGGDTVNPAQEAVALKNQKLADEDDRKRAEKKLAKEAKKTNA